MRKLDVKLTFAYFGKTSGILSLSECNNPEKFDCLVVRALNMPKAPSHCIQNRAILCEGGDPDLDCIRRITRRGEVNDSRTAPPRRLSNGVSDVFTGPIPRSSLSVTSARTYP